MRKRLKKIPALRSAYYLSMALRQMVEDQWRKPSSFDRIFDASPDPWNSSGESEKERFAVTLSVLDAAGAQWFGTALEIGCAEGVFTEMLAERCEALTSVDFSTVALDRAKERLRGRSNVRLARWDMRREHLDARYQLVVAMGVITSLYRPSEVRRVCRAIRNAIEPGGYLLFSDVRQSRVFENAWWGPMMLRGGEQIRRLLMRDRALQLIRARDTETHVFALFRRG